MKLSDTELDYLSRLFRGRIGRDKPATASLSGRRTLIFTEVPLKKIRKALLAFMADYENLIDGEWDELSPAIAEINE